LHLVPGGVDDGLLAGIEDADDLVEDLTQAFQSSLDQTQKLRVLELTA